MARLLCMATWAPFVKVGVSPDADHSPCIAKSCIGQRRVAQCECRSGAADGAPLSLAGKKALVVGTGGAGQAVAYYAAQAGAQVG